MMNLAEYRKRPALLADWLPWAALVAPGTVLNKDGSFQRTLRFRGPDLDSVTQAELVATSARLNNALRRLGSGWAIFVEAERHEASGYPVCVFPEGLSWLVDEERRAAFEEAGSHFESRYHLTLLYLPPEESKARAATLLYPRHEPPRSCTRMPVKMNDCVRPIGASAWTASWRRPSASLVCSKA
jgi:type IV secretion system protein TrbE